MTEDQGLIYAYLLDGVGGGKPLDWKAIADWTPDQGVLWIHLDRMELSARQWLRDSDWVDPLLVGPLLAKGSRPRTTEIKDELLVILRGVNLNPGQDPENMVSIRMYVTPQRIITLRRQGLLAVEDVVDALAQGTGPRNAGEFLAQMAEHLTDRMQPTLTELEEEMEALEDEMLESENYAHRERLGGIQRETNALLRHLTPQRQALKDLHAAKPDWLTFSHRLQLNEVIDQATRYVENLDAGRERALVLHERIAEQLSEQMNRAVYVLSLLAAIFLPLDFLTGLFGVNLGGVPGLADSDAFFILVGVQLILALLLIWVFLRLRWLRPLRW